jgi:putative endonuclease
MLLCADGSYYVGSSRHEDLGIRISEHEAGIHDGYTKSRRPVKLVWCEHFPQISDAVLFERQLKGWSRAKKEALIRGDWDAVHALARRRAGAPRLNPRPSRPPPHPKECGSKPGSTAAPQDED